MYFKSDTFDNKPWCLKFGVADYYGLLDLKSEDNWFKVSKYCWETKLVLYYRYQEFFPQWKRELEKHCKKLDFFVLVNWEDQKVPLEKLMYRFEHRLRFIGISYRPLLPKSKLLLFEFTKCNNWKDVEYRVHTVGCLNKYAHNINTRDIAMSKWTISNWRKFYKFTRKLDDEDFKKWRREKTIELRIVQDNKKSAVRRREKLAEKKDNVRDVKRKIIAKMRKKYGRIGMGVWGNIETENKTKKALDGFGKKGKKGKTV